MTGICLKFISSKHNSKTRSSVAKKQNIPRNITQQQ